MTTRTRVAVLLALSLLVAACSDAAQPTSTTAAPTTTTTEAPASFPVTVAAANGEIEISEMPANVVSLSATHTEMLFAIGAGDQVVAADSFSNYPPEAPTTDISAFAPNVESILGFDPDLVVIDGDWDGTTVGALTEIGVPVLVLPAAQSFDDVYAQIEVLGVATGNVGGAAEVVLAMQTDIDEIISGLPETDAVTFYHELDTTYYSVTSETFIGQVYALMGLENIADAVGEGSFGFPQLSEEHILSSNPDLIFLADTICCDVNAATIAERPGWDTLDAVAGGHVVELNDDVASRWGPRIVDHMRAVADALASLTVDA